MFVTPWWRHVGSDMSGRHSETVRHGVVGTVDLRWAGLVAYLLRHEVGRGRLSAATDSHPCTTRPMRYSPTIQPHSRPTLESPPPAAHTPLPHHAHTNVRHPSRLLRVRPLATHDGSRIRVDPSHCVPRHAMRRRTQDGPELAVEYSLSRRSAGRKASSIRPAWVSHAPCVESMPRLVPAHPTPSSRMPVQIHSGNECLGTGAPYRLGE